MVFTDDELLMFNVMKAIYESGIPMGFKGSMVLKACLEQAGYTDNIRQTVDIDGNWFSENEPTVQEMAESLNYALNKNNVGLIVESYREYGEGKSAGFRFINVNDGEKKFTMDVDVNRPCDTMPLYQIRDFTFYGVSPSQMIADKVTAISTNKVFRRIKDMIDIYYLSSVFALDKTDLNRVLNITGRKLENFDGFLNRKADLEHAYEKFNIRGEVVKPPFEEVYNANKRFMKEILDKVCDTNKKHTKDDKVR